MEESASLEPPNSAPWLVFPYGEENLSSRLIVLCDVKDDNSMPNQKYGDCFLWNPLSFETIQLPSLLPWITSQPHGMYFIDCVLSSPPRTNLTEDVDSNDNDDPLVLVLYLPLSDPEYIAFNYTFLFCHPGENQWRTQLFSEEINGRTFEVEYLHCFKNKLYALGVTGHYLEIEKQHQVRDGDDNVSLSIKSFQVNDHTSVPLHGARDVCLGQTHFVEGHDDIFMVRRSFNDRGSEKIMISMRITRLDFILMEWKLVNSLGDNVLFVGPENRICFSAAKLGLSRGCLYYILPVDQFELYCLPMGYQISPADMRLFKFEVEGAEDYDISPYLRLPEPVFAPDWMVMPNGQRRKVGNMNVNEEDQDDISKEVGNKASASSYNYSETESGKQLLRLGAVELEEEKIPWDILIEDMVVLIASYLHPLDYVHFRSVCKANRQIMPVGMSTFTSSQVLDAAHLSPLLLFSRDNSSTVYSLANPMHDNENYLMNFSELLLDATIRFQKGGWLLMSREIKLFFYNPFTRDIILLPDFPGCYFTVDISFSSIPTSSDCIVFAVEGNASPDVNEISLHCIRRGEQVGLLISLMRKCTRLYVTL
ncbi:uncharacterized protein LOC113318751 isoform X1 [Papaver somniferum]|uniref:uncharacterized protein LOC113318751 isoform X1 n=1 Tax=Papaver somniferum TaxID=3469 RepID=UPI000E6FD0A8|nr:uncharacterized protein LOC113318751 isoform X1 [Papaver somniferum]